MESGAGDNLISAESDTEAIQSTCEEAEGDPWWHRLRPYGRDPILGVPLPQGSSRVEKESAQRDHMAAAKSQVNQLTPPIEPLPRLSETSQRLSAVGPHGARRLRRTRMSEVRELARKLRKRSDELIARADAHVASLLRAARPGGVHVVLIDYLLQEIGYADQQLAADLLSGFDLVGEIPIAPGAEPTLVQVLESTTEHVDSCARALADKFIRQQLAPAASIEEQSARREVYDQTVEDQQPPARIGPFRAPRVGSRRVAPPTRRFGIRQLSSSGKDKIRCIDDFAAWLVNRLVRVNRRIRMCRIADVLGCASVLSGRRGRRVRLLKSDLKAAYRCCPIRKEHLEYASTLVRHPDSGEVLEAT